MNYKNNSENEKDLNNYENNNEITGIPEVEHFDKRAYFYLLDSYQPVFIELEGVSRVLGPEHSLTRLMKDAVESLDEEMLKIAQAAFEAMPEHVLNRIHHPWIGCPPPPGTREKLRKKLIPELVGEARGVEPVSCYLQIDAREGYQDSLPWPADEDGHVVDSALVYDPRCNGWPVRVQIAEGSDQKVVLDLLKKMAKTLEQDWDKLTDPTHYWDIFPEDGTI